MVFGIVGGGLSNKSASVTFACQRGKERFCKRSILSLSDFLWRPFKDSLDFCALTNGKRARLSWTTNQRLTNDECTSCEYHKGTFKCLVKLYFIGQVADKKISTKSCLTTKRCFFLNSIIILLIRKPLQYNNLVLFCTFLQRHEQILVLVHITSGYCPRTKN